MPSLQPTCLLVALAHCAASPLLHLQSPPVGAAAFLEEKAWQSSNGAGTEGTDVESLKKEIQLLKHQKGQVAAALERLQKFSGTEKGNDVLKTLHQNLNAAELTAQSKKEELAQVQSADASQIDALSRRQANAEKELLEIEVAQLHDQKAKLQQDRISLISLSEAQKLNSQLRAEQRKLQQEYSQYKAKLQSMSEAADASEAQIAQHAFEIHSQIASAEATVHQKQNQLRKVTADGWRRFAGSSTMSHHNVIAKIKSGEKANALLQANINDLIVKDETSVTQAAKMHKEMDAIRELEAKEANKVSAAMEAKKKESAKAKDLEAANQQITTQMHKSEKLRPQIAQLTRRSQSLLAMRSKVEAGTKADEEQNEAIKHQQHQAAEQIAEERSKMEFTFEQTKTDKRAAAMLQGENKKLTSDLEEMRKLPRAIELEVEHGKQQTVTIKALEAESAAKNSRKGELISQMLQLTHHSSLLVDKFNTLHEKVVAATALQKENTWLRSQIDKINEEEGDAEWNAKQTEGKAKNSEALQAENNDLQRQLSEARQRVAALQERQDQAESKIVRLTKKPRRMRKPRNPDPLEKANVELSALVSQLNAAQNA